MNCELFKHNAFVARNLCYDVIIRTDVMKGELFKHNAFVARNLCFDVIIRTGVMKRVGAILDMKDGSVNWNEHYVKFLSDRQDIRCSVHMLEKIEIPAISQVMCVATNKKLVFTVFRVS